MYASDAGSTDAIQTMARDQTLKDTNIVQPAPTDTLLFQNDQSFLYGDFLGFNLLDGWQMEQSDLAGVY